MKNDLQDVSGLKKSQSLFEPKEETDSFAPVRATPSEFRSRGANSHTDGECSSRLAEGPPPAELDAVPTPGLRAAPNSARKAFGLTLLSATRRQKSQPFLARATDGQNEKAQLVAEQVKRSLGSSERETVDQVNEGVSSNLQLPWPEPPRAQSGAEQPVEVLNGAGQRRV